MRSFCIHKSYKTSEHFWHLLKSEVQKTKRNIALSITEFTKLRQHCLSHQEDEFNVLVALALETGAKRGELLGLKNETYQLIKIFIKHY